MSSRWRSSRIFTPQSSHLAAVLICRRSAWRPLTALWLAKAADGSARQGRLSSGTPRCDRARRLDGGFSKRHQCCNDDAMEEPSIEDAVRWLRRSYRAGAVVDALAALGM